MSQPTLKRQMTLKHILWVSAVAVIFAGVVSIVCSVFAPSTSSKEAVMFLDKTARDYLAGEILVNEKRFGDVKEQLVDLGEREHHSTYITYLEEPRDGVTVAEALEVAKEEAEAKLRRQSDDFIKDDVLLVILLETPRSFVIRGFGRVRDKLAIRGISAKYGLRHEQLVYRLDAPGEHLQDSLGRIENDLRPLNFFIRNSPLPPGSIEAVISMFSRGVATNIPDFATSGFVKAFRWFASGADGGSRGSISMVVLLIVVLGVLLLVPGLLQSGFRTVAQPRLGKFTYSGAALIVKTALVATFWISPFCLVIMLFFGDLSDVVTISQISGESVVNLTRWTRDINRLNISVPPLVAAVAAYLVVVALLLRIGDRAVEAAVELGHAISLNPGLALTSPLTTLGIIVSLPFLLFVILFSLEGSFGAAILLVLTMDALWIVGSEIARRRRIPDVVLASA